MGFNTCVKPKVCILNELGQEESSFFCLAFFKLQFILQLLPLSGIQFIMIQFSCVNMSDNNYNCKLFERTKMVSVKQDLRRTSYLWVNHKDRKKHLVILMCLRDSFLIFPPFSSESGLPDLCHDPWPLALQNRIHSESVTYKNNYNNSQKTFSPVAEGPKCNQISHRL